MGDKAAVEESQVTGKGTYGTMLCFVSRTSPQRLCSELWEGYQIVGHYAHQYVNPLNSAEMAVLLGDGAWSEGMGTGVTWKVMSPSFSSLGLLLPGPHCVNSCPLADLFTISFMSWWQLTMD